jgi:hypothetical protein
VKGIEPRDGGETARDDARHEAAPFDEVVQQAHHPPRGRLKIF